MSAPGDPEYDARRPAPDYIDGTLTDEHYRAAGGVAGRPFVMVHRGDRARVEVGDGARFGPDVRILTGGNHQAGWVTTFALREVYGLPGAYVDNPISRGDVVVGDRASLGEGSYVVSGIAVGAGATVRPYSVVTRDVPPGAVVGGSPAHPVAGSPAAAVGSPRPPARRPGRPWRDRLRSFAGRLDPGAVAWSDFPAVLARYPQDELELGFASYDAPRVWGPAEGGHHVSFGAYCSLAWDGEVLVDPAAEPRDLRAVALAVQADEPVPADHPGLRVEVGHDVWFARCAKLLGGVRVGHGAIVATSAVVRDDVRPYAIVAGNPAREVGRRFTDEQVEGLLAVAWWDWPDELVRERYLELCSDDIDGFIARHRGA